MQKEQQYLADMEQRKRFLLEEVENLELHKKKLTSDINHLKEEETEEQLKHNNLRIILANETQLLLKDRTLDIAGIEERLNNRENGIKKRENEIKKMENDLTERELTLSEKENKFENDKKVSDGYFASGAANREVYGELLDGIKFNIEGSDKSRKQAEIDLRKAKEIRGACEIEYDIFVANRDAELENMRKEKERLKLKEEELSKKEMVVDKKIEIAVEEKERAKAELRNLMHTKKYV